MFCDKALAFILNFSARAKHDGLSQRLQKKELLFLQGILA